ncbi:hypothetical protein [Runella aurantiaca]|uniref:WG repeat-containing protein n=1 Tax=Runella aurantiaca TaxID=2282308 RepID=A0A369I3E0_9BACT|nr:hypothetical protein [Runella aurantiaca]RDB02775.1 hypothetical protein DVG78_27055 [Runella aurantiaca]
MTNSQIFRIGVFITLLSFVSMSVFAQVNYKQSFNLHKDGKIIDNKGKVIGYVHDSFKGSACSIHCFQNSMAKNADGSRLKHQQK